MQQMFQKIFLTLINKPQDKEKNIVNLCLNLIKNYDVVKHTKHDFILIFFIIISVVRKQFYIFT